MYITAWLGMPYKKCIIFENIQTKEEDVGKFYQNKKCRPWEWRELEIVSKVINTL